MTFNSSLEKNIFYNFPVFLFSLLPFFLITGPFLSDLSVSLIGLIFLIYCFKEKKFNYFHNNFFYFFLFFCGYLILNIIVNNFNLNLSSKMLWKSRLITYLDKIISGKALSLGYLKYNFESVFFIRKKKLCNGVLNC